MKSLNEYAIEQINLNNETNSYLISVNENHNNIIYDEDQIDEGLISWLKRIFSKGFDKISDYIKRNNRTPEFKVDKDVVKQTKQYINFTDNVTIRQVLSKESGFPQFAKLFNSDKGRTVYKTDATQYLMYTINPVKNNYWVNDINIPVCFVGFTKDQDQLKNNTLEICIFTVSAYVSSQSEKRVFTKLFIDYIKENPKYNNVNRIQINLDTTNLSSYKNEYVGLGFKEDSSNDDIYYIHF